METNPEKSHLKGQALIALAAVAGVVVAGRLSRAGLALAAGLAWHLWNSRTACPSSSVESGLSAEPPSDTAPPPGPSILTEDAANPLPVLPNATAAREEMPAALPALPRVDAPRSSAWDDLRAALTPALTILTDETNPGGPSSGTSWVPDPAPALPTAHLPDLPEIHPFPPTDPWIESAEAIQHPVAEPQTVEEPAQPEFLIDPEEQTAMDQEESLHLPPATATPGTTTLLPRSCQPPDIVVRKESNSAPTAVPMLTAPGQVTRSSDEAKDGETGSASAGEKKNFFDWLRS